MARGAGAVWRAAAGRGRARGAVLQQLQQQKAWMSGSRAKALPMFEYDVDALYETNYLNMPKLPLPEVKDTLRRYLETVRPLASDEEMARMQALAAKFEQEHAPQLQEALKELSNQPAYPYSYIEQFWDDMYLGGRFEIMVGSNPFYLFPSETNPAYQSQTARAARMTSALVRWWQKVVSGDMEADMERDKPLCMFSFGRVFGAARYPGVGRDTLVFNSARRHIIVLCNHQVFKVEVVDKNGVVASGEELEPLLAAVRDLALSREGDVLQDVGILTGQERDYWAKLHAKLQSGGPVTAHTLEQITDCLFAVTLDQTTPRTPEEVSDCLLHGGNGSNRWFDKHNVIVTKDGTMGMNFDHTFGDGLVWNRMLNEVWADMQGTKSGFSPLPSPRGGFSGSFAPLEWELPAEVAAEMPKALANNEKLAGDVDTRVLDFQEFGRNRMKEMKVSPDAVCQMAFQLAYHKVHNAAPAVYESCAMRNYWHGRTETIRSCTSESTAMVKTFLSAKASDEDKRRALHEAGRVHVEVAKGAKAAIGPYQGVDRHMHAMKCVAALRGLKVPIFEDELYSRSSTWVLSTSNVSAPFIDRFGFGAVCGHGYGLGYMTQPDSVPINITSYHSGARTSSSQLCDAIAESLREFDALFKR